MQVGGLISTSNVLQTGVKQVTVDTSHMHSAVDNVTHTGQINIRSLMKTLEHTIMYYILLNCLKNFWHLLGAQHLIVCLYII